MGLIDLMIAITTRRSGAAIRPNDAASFGGCRYHFSRWGAYPGVHVNNSVRHFWRTGGPIFARKIFCRSRANRRKRNERAYALGWLAALYYYCQFSYLCSCTFAMAALNDSEVSRFASDI